MIEFLSVLAFFLILGTTLVNTLAIPSLLVGEAMFRFVFKKPWENWAIRLANYKSDFIDFGTIKDAPDLLMLWLLELLLGVAILIFAAFLAAVNALGWFLIIFALLFAARLAVEYFGD